MSHRRITIHIIAYPDCMLSAVYGLREQFALANDICIRRAATVRFESMVTGVDTLGTDPAPVMPGVIILPPNIGGTYHLDPDASMTRWLHRRHADGAMVCSACAGAFILAAAGLLHQRPATTHWGLAALFAERFPDVALDADRILINDGDIITAGGLMSWVDLGLELVARFAGPAIMRELGKVMVVDTGQREQRYYQRFTPILDHGDAAILTAQHRIQARYPESITITALAGACALGERTFLRRFVKATGLKPIQYLQRVRVQQACDILETTAETVELISDRVGYADPGAFRKIFHRIMGLTPKRFRERFAHTASRRHR